MDNGDDDDDHNGRTKNADASGPRSGSRLPQASSAEKAKECAVRVSEPSTLCVHFKVIPL